MFESFWGELDKIYTNTRRPRKSKSIDQTNLLMNINGQKKKCNSKQKGNHKPNV